MDDPRTRAALDNLADLFLTGAAPVGAGVTAGAGAASASASKPPPPTGASTAAASPGVSALDGPRPIRLGPKLRPAPASPSAPGAGVGLPMPPARSAGPRPAGPAGAAPGIQAANAGSSASGTVGSIGLNPNTLGRDSIDDDGSFDVDNIDAFDQRSPRAGIPAVEAVFLGNLPGFGGPWLTQYARFLAQHGPGPVGVLRVDGEHVSLELVGTPRPPLPRDLGEEDAQSQPTLESWAALAATEENLIELLDGLATFEATPVRRWIVNFVRPAEAGAVAMARQIDRWTFLCGADQAAVVGAYRLLKQLVDADGGKTDRRVGFMIMGSDEATSRRIFDRVGAAAAEGLLTRPLEFRGVQKQMMPVSLHVIGSFAQTPRLWSEMLDFFRSQEAIPESTPDESPAATGLAADEAEDELAFPSAGKSVGSPAPAPSARGDARLVASLDFESLPEEMVSVDPPARPAAPSVAAHAPTPASPASATNAAPPAERVVNLQPPAAEPVGTGAHAPADEAPAASPTTRPGSFLPPRANPPAARPAAAAAASAPAPGNTGSRVVTAEPVIATAPALADEAGPDLTPYVAGGVALEARCPRHPQTHLVLDEQGVLHLLRRHTSTPAPGIRRDPVLGEQGQDALRAALVELIEARAWVRENLALLSMTQRQFRFDVAAEPVLHLFTDQAKPAAALVARLGALMKLHLLHEVRVGGTVSWFSTELN